MINIPTNSNVLPELRKFIYEKLSCNFLFLVFFVPLFVTKVKLEQRNSLLNPVYEILSPYFETELLSYRVQRTFQHSTLADFRFYISDQAMIIFSKNQSLSYLINYVSIHSVEEQIFDPEVISIFENIQRTNDLHLVSPKTLEKIKQDKQVLQFVKYCFDVQHSLKEIDQMLKVAFAMSLLWFFIVL